MPYYTPLTYQTAEELQEKLGEKCCNFIAYAKEQDEYPSSYLLAEFLDISETTFWRYRKEKRYEQFHDTLSKAMTTLGIKDMTALHKEGSKAAELSLKRIHKLTEKQEIDQTLNATVTMGTVKIDGQELKLEA